MGKTKIEMAFREAISIARKQGLALTNEEVEAIWEKSTARRYAELEPISDVILPEVGKAD